MGAKISAPADRRAKNVRVRPVVIPELEFSDVQREVLFADLVKTAHDAALNQRPEALDGLRVDRADNVLLAAVIHATVRIFGIESVVAGPCVCAEQTNLRRDAFADELRKSCGADVINHARNHVALAAQGADHRRLAGADAASAAALPALVLVLVLGEAADECFVNLDNAHELLEILINQPGSDAVAHVVSRLIGAETEHALYLQSGNALFAGEHHVNDAEPLAEGNLRIFKDGPDQDGEAIAGGRACVALPAEAAYSVGLHSPATRAVDAFRPAVRGEVSLASIIVGERRFPLADGHLMDALAGLFHGRTPISVSGPEHRETAVFCQQPDSRPNLTERPQTEHGLPPKLSSSEVRYSLGV
jgi:hypothetical protein